MDYGTQSGLGRAMGIVGEHLLGRPERLRQQRLDERQDELFERKMADYDHRSRINDLSYEQTLLKFTQLKEGIDRDKGRRNLVSGQKLDPLQRELLFGSNTDLIYQLDDETGKWGLWNADGERIDSKQWVMDDIGNHDLEGLAERMRAAQALDYVRDNELYPLLERDLLESRSALQELGMDDEAISDYQKNFMDSLAIAYTVFGKEALNPDAIRQGLINPEMSMLDIFMRREQTFDAPTMRTMKIGDQYVEMQWDAQRGEWVPLLLGDQVVSGPRSVAGAGTRSGSGGIGFGLDTGTGGRDDPSPLSRNDQEAIEKTMVSTFAPWWHEGAQLDPETDQLIGLANTMAINIYTQTGKRDLRKSTDMAVNYFKAINPDPADREVDVRKMLEERAKADGITKKDRIEEYVEDEMKAWNSSREKAMPAYQRMIDDLAKGRASLSDFRQMGITSNDLRFADLGSIARKLDRLDKDMQDRHGDSERYAAWKFVQPFVEQGQIGAGTIALYATQGEADGLDNFLDYFMSEGMFEGYKLVEGMPQARHKESGEQYVVAGGRVMPLSGVDDVDVKDEIRGGIAGGDAPGVPPGSQTPEVAAQEPAPGASPGLGVSNEARRSGASPPERSQQAPWWSAEAADPQRREFYQRTGAAWAYGGNPGLEQAAKAAEEWAVEQAQAVNRGMYEVLLKPFVQSGQDINELVQDFRFWLKNTYNEDRVSRAEAMSRQDGGQELSRLLSEWQGDTLPFSHSHILEQPQGDFTPPESTSGRPLAPRPGDPGPPGLAGQQGAAQPSADAAQALGDLVANGDPTARAVLLNMLVNEAGVPDYVQAGEVLEGVLAWMQEMARASGRDLTHMQPEEQMRLFMNILQSPAGMGN